MTAADDDEGDPRDGDEAATDDGAARRRGSEAIYAPNWKLVLAVDGLLGVVLLVVGLVATVAWNPLAGGFLGSCGFVYVAFVVKRARDWRDLRRDAGLSG
jgi:hypothetical protein